MKLNQIITSLLETDMYKFSMGEAIYHQFSDYKTTWTFKCVILMCTLRRDGAGDQRAD